MLLVPAFDERRAGRRRRLVAAGLEHAVRSADHARPGHSAVVGVDRAAVVASADRLLTIADLLRSGVELPERGVSAAYALLTDGAGPLYVRAPGRDLPSALADVERALGVRTA